jgi:hypothetical protein
MKTTVLIAAALAAGSTSAFAQDPPAQPPVQSTQSVPAAAPAPPAASAAPARPTAAPPSEERLREVKFMEELFANAVKAGAQDLTRQMQQADRNSLIADAGLANNARARGIVLDGYGIVFDVDVPLMNVSIVTTLRQSIVNDLRDQIHELQLYLARSTDPAEQQRLSARLKMLTMNLEMMAPLQEQRAIDNTLLDTRMANGLAAPVANPQPPGTVSAASTDATLPAVSPIESKDTNTLYSDAVKKALINAMLDHSAGLRLADDEWLLVAARDNAGAGALNERSGILLRIKGSDVTAYQHDKLTRDEVLKKLEIREWR